MFNRIFRAVALIALFVFLAMGVLGMIMIWQAKEGADFQDLLLWYLLPCGVIAGLGFFLCGVAAHIASERIATPLNAMTPVKPISEVDFPEVAPLTKRLQAMQTEFAQKKEEFDLTTKYMTEGLILLSSDGKVLSINDATRRILRLDSQVEGRDILFLYPSSQLRELLYKVREGKRAEAILHIRNVAYQMNASPIFQAGALSGVVLLIFDITQREQAEKMRREFTANVSHELKTPLQTISGCAELLSGGMVKEEDVPKFSEQIYTEARRMIALVEDIIKLSRLDEGEGNFSKEQVDLLALAKKTADVLQPAAEAADVTLSVDGERCFIEGIPQLLEGILYNLCDNAIKYNVACGSVSMTVKNEKNGAVLTVSDTGIGIPIHQQERVFERFYRVDKSHSKKVGGTGLGLSIVKHAAKLHDADVRLKSEPGKGTTVTILFPIE